MGPVVRRPVAWVAAIVLFVEAIGIALLNWFLGVVVDRQDMSLAGLDSDMMSVSSKAGGLVFGLYFAACAVSALLVALRDRAPGLLGRVLLVSAAVVHGLLGAFTVGLVGWGAFAFMMVVLGLITTKRGELESKDTLKRRIDEAAKFVDLDQLCLSPQCGFSSTLEGNELTADEQFAKLRLIVETAQEVWGSA